MNYNEKLNQLRAVIGAECERRMKQDHELGANEVGEWLMRHRRTLVIDGLTDLVCQVMEQRNDDERVERILKAKLEPEEHVRAMRGVSDALGVPMWFLLTLEPECGKAAFMAAALIHRLRADEARASLEAIRQAQEYLRPVMDGHPEMTAGEAMEEMQRRTDQTIRGLETD